MACAAISGAAIRGLYHQRGLETPGDNRSGSLLRGTDAVDAVGHASQPASRHHLTAGKKKKKRRGGKKAWCLAGSSCYSENGLTAAVNNPFHSSVGVRGLS